MIKPIRDGDAVPIPSTTFRMDHRFKPLWKRRWLLLGVATVVAVLTYLHYARQPDQFRSQATVFLQVSQLEQSALVPSDPVRSTARQVALLTTEKVGAGVARRINFGGKPRALGAAVSVSLSKDTDFVTISATSGTASGAATIANAYANAFVELRTSESRKRAVESLERARALLAGFPSAQGFAAIRTGARRGISRLEAALALPISEDQFVTRARPAATPFTPTPALNATFGFMLGLLLAAAAAYAFERLDQRIKDASELETLLGVPVLAELPLAAEPTSFVGAHPRVAHELREPMRRLRLGTGLATAARETHTLLVASAISGEGRSTVVRNLAITCAEAGLSVAVIEADLRQPTLAQQFRIAAAPGLSEVVACQQALSDAFQSVNVTIGTSCSQRRGVYLAPKSANGVLKILAAGTAVNDAPTVIGSRAVRDILAELPKRFDVVLIDTPQLHLADAHPLLRAVDAVVVVARMGLTTRDAARRLARTLQASGDVRVLGVVANDVPTATATYPLHGSDNARELESMPDTRLGRA